MAAYDSIGSKYDFVKTVPFNDLEQHTFRPAVEKYMTGANINVIEFASGTGFYSERLLKWGAAKLTGVDISSAMVEAATARLRNSDLAPRARFVVADGREASKYYESESDKFDIATGAWFLNYAESQAAQAAMLKTVALNLKESGVFIGICPHPVEDFDSWKEKSGDEVVNRTGLRFDYVNKLENGEGYKILVSTFPPGKPEEPVVQFDTFFLRKSVYEEAAKEAGFSKIEWHTCDFSVDGWRAKVGLEGDDEGWKKLTDVPLLSVLVLSKQ